MHIVLIFEIIGAVFAAFGMVCLWHFVTDAWRGPEKILTALVYDGSFEAEELGCLVSCSRRRFSSQRRTAVIVTPQARLPDEVAQALKDNNVEIYYITYQ
ncbi:MAG: hypothetical protein IJY27_03165 [Clostridia bacterium]|nr:hypothetical protein [Clostridia bacterium]